MGVACEGMLAPSFSSRNRGKYILHRINPRDPSARFHERGIVAADHHGGCRLGSITHDGIGRSCELVGTRFSRDAQRFSEEILRSDATQDRFDTCVCQRESRHTNPARTATRIRDDDTQPFPVVSLSAEPRFPEMARTLHGVMRPSDGPVIFDIGLIKPCIGTQDSPLRHALRLEGCEERHRACAFHIAIHASCFTQHGLCEPGILITLRAPGSCLFPWFHCSQVDSGTFGSCDRLGGDGYDVAIAEFDGFRNESGEVVAISDEPCRDREEEQGRGSMMSFMLLSPQLQIQRSILQEVRADHSLFCMEIDRLHRNRQHIRRSILNEEGARNIRS